MINANKIAFTYDKKKEFIKDLTFNIEKGKITTILGPNGSGKIYSAKFIMWTK